MQPTLVKPVQLIITVILLTVSDVHYFSMLFASQWFDILLNTRAVELMR